MGELESDCSSNTGVRKESTHLTDRQIIIGFWVVLASLVMFEGQKRFYSPKPDCEHDMYVDRPDLHMGIGVQELSDMFDEMGVSLSPETVCHYADTIGMLQESVVSISVARYDHMRLDLFAQWRKITGAGKASWPPISRTIATRLGDGQWNRAICRLAISVQSQGKALGESKYDDNVMMEALHLYLSECDLESVKGTYQGYIEWKKNDRGETLNSFPSASTVRQRFGSWEKAVQRAREMVTKLS